MVLNAKLKWVGQLFIYRWQAYVVDSEFSFDWSGWQSIKTVKINHNYNNLHLGSIHLLEF